MREDMYKVIVERPRRGGGVQGDGRQWRNSRDRGSHLGMTQGYRFGKGLNENLAPLRRWLHQQVHRPWDKVYAELCAGIDRRNTVQAHIYQHLDDFVDRAATWVDGQVMVREWWRGTRRVPLHEASYVELFVHPLTGILLPNRRQAEARKGWRGRRNPAPAPRRIAIDDWTQWHQIDGGWFELGLDLLPPAGDRSPQRWDALRECWLTRGSTPPQGTLTGVALFGRANVYAASKRSLGRAEIRRRFPNGMPA
ncbi:hypothetical protein ACSFA8_08720 [Variovorax sp. RT4R15]|uniref:hypothetical protein n=1 Tax=Variovorax sp. RT4R15 TaxID=3443737 RepID=UPI003F455B96